MHQNSIQNEHVQNCVREAIFPIIGWPILYKSTAAEPGDFCLQEWDIRMIKAVTVDNVRSMI